MQIYYLHTHTGRIMTQALSGTPGIYTVFICATVLLLFATFKAYVDREHYQKLLLWGALADGAFAIMALASGIPIAATGALLFVLFQLASRGLAYTSLTALCKTYVDENIPKHNAIYIQKAAAKNTKAAALFALGLLASIGGSPFLVPEGRFFATQGIINANFFGYIPILILVAACTTFFVYLHITVVRKVYLENTSDVHNDHLQETPKSCFCKGHIGTCAIIFAIAVLLCGFMRTPLTQMFASITGAQLQHTSVHMAFVVLFCGSFITAIIGTKRPEYREKMALGIMLVAFVCALFFGDISPMARLFAVLISGMGCIVTLYSIGYMAHGHRLHSYYFFLLLTFASLIGIVTSPDLAAFYGYWELMTFASFFLVVHERTGAQGKTVLDAGNKYYLMCAGGALLMLPGLALLGSESTAFAAIANTSYGMTPTTLKIALMLALTGFAVKAGLVPLHAWLPDAHPAAPSSVSGPLSGIITKLGIFGIIMILLGQAGGASLQMTGQGGFSDNSALPWIGYYLSFLGGITLIFGEVMALRQEDIKRLLAYSTLGQIGEIVLVLGLGTYLATVGALTHVINHAIMKDLLFLGAGALILRTGSRNLKDLQGLGTQMPITVGCMAVGLVAIMGLPPFAGFVGKYLMIQAAISSGHWLMAALIIAGSLVGAVYYTRILRTLIFEKVSPNMPLASLTLKEEGPMAMALMVLTGLTVILGLYPNLSLGLICQAAGQFFLSSAAMDATLASVHVSWPIYVLIPMLGAILPLIYKNERIIAGRCAVGVLLLTTVLVLIFGQDMDKLSFGFAIIVPLIGALNMLYAIGYMEHSHTQWRFYAFFCAMCAGLLGLASAKNLFSFFLFWEIMSSWALYFTIAHEGTKESLAEAFKYFLFNLAGAGCIFLGVCILGAYTSLSLTVTAQGYLPSATSLTSFAGYALLALGFIMKAAQLPFRIDWQMHPALAPTPVSGFISSVLLKSALLGLMKLFIIIGGGLTLLHAITPTQIHTVQVLTMWIGAITLVMAATQALMSSNLKLIFIYSTVSQIGYMVLAIAVGTSLGYAGGLLHVINHVFFKDLLFLMCGVLMFQSHKDNLHDLGGIGHRMPFTLSMFTIAGLSVVGIPPTSGFTSKWIIYHALMEANQPFLALLSLIGSVITLAYIAKFLHTAFMGQTPKNMEELSHVHDAPTTMRIPMTILAIGCVLLGLFPGLMLYPINGILNEYGLQTLHVGLSGVQSGPAAWNATNMFVMMAIAFVAAYKGLLYFVNKNCRITPVHSCGLSPEDATSRMQPSSVYGGLITFWRESFMPALCKPRAHNGKKEN